MKQFLSIIILFSVIGCNNKGIDNQTLDLLDTLDYYIEHEQLYRTKKEDCITNFKLQIAENKENNEQLYEIYDKLFTHYKSYIYDSAFYCAEHLLTIANEMNEDCKRNDAKIKLCFCYLSSGLFSEAFDILKNINIENCDDNLKIDFYLTKARLYYDRADYNNDYSRTSDEEIGNKTMLQALKLLPKNSMEYYASLGLKEMKSGNLEQAITAFEQLIASQNRSEHDFAIATSSLAYIHSLQNNKQKEKDFLLKAAIADIKSSTMETVALRNLAQYLYNEGDVSRAAQYIRKAFNDALFYNARHRQMEIGNILPIIEQERITMLEMQRNRMRTFFAITCSFIFLITIALIIIVRQLNKINNAKKIIQKNVDDLTKTNAHLLEANKIKEEYIGNFFNLNSEYVEKLEAFQRWVNRKVESRQYTDLQKIPKKLDTQQEREKLFKMFDKTFLNIFPNFVTEFNKLLKNDGKIVIQDGELLNNDLRIYALMRLGIKNNDKIAQFLNYSVNTIYTYKTKIKNRALDYEKFNEKLMEIKSI